MLKNAQKCLKIMKKYAKQVFLKRECFVAKDSLN